MFANAHNAVQYALSKGIIQKPSRCESCNEEADIEGHHENLEDQLNVTWLCRKCHIDLHMKLGTFSTKKKKEGRTGKSHFVYFDRELNGEIMGEIKKSGLSVSAWLRLACLEKLRKKK